jgi:hypothetical protein
LWVWPDRDNLIHIVLEAVGKDAGLAFAGLPFAFDHDNRIGDKQFFDFGIGAWKDNHFTLTPHVLNLDKGHLVALFGVDGTHAGDHADNQHIFAVVALIQLAAPTGDNVARRPAILSPTANGRGLWLLRCWAGQ